MIKNISCYIANDTDPHYNLAVEEYLMTHVGEDECILYLWQNRHTVVIGRNQSAWKECRTGDLERDGGTLARRLSGGGAVYHDLGNLNFTFLVSDENYDLDRQMQVIAEACRSMGIAVERSGRNDILADGRKFSGNAFYSHHGKSYHHGTLMLHVDKEKLGAYLNPSKAKLEAKGVASVRSRVVNLSELCSDITVEKMCRAMETAFEKVYGLGAKKLRKEDFAASEIEALYARNHSWEWNYGQKLPCTFSCDARFAWGEAEIRLTVKEGFVKAAEVYSDAMEWNFAEALKTAFLNARFTVEDLQARVKESCPQTIAEDLCALLAKQDI
ncbi:MAG: lipoate--protein ligase [Oscillospiraceae bacterium]|nr:lipoate--protein ligase [Oscillospiraceae bacterium]